MTAEINEATNLKSQGLLPVASREQGSTAFLILEPYITGTAGSGEAPATREEDIVLWLDASQELDAGATNGQTLNSVTDWGSIGETVTKVDVAPTFATSGGYNGREAFDMTGAAFASTHESISGTANYVMAYVIRYDGLSGDQYLRGGSGSTAIFGWEAGGNQRGRLFTTGAGGYFTTGPQATAMANTNRIVICRKVGTTATLFVDGVKYDSQSFAPGSHNWLVIGGGYYGGVLSRFSNALLSELRDYVGPFTDQECSDLYDELAAKWHA